MAYLADTNIVIRRVVSGDPHYATISAALTLLDQQGETVYITAQNLGTAKHLTLHIFAPDALKTGLQMKYLLFRVALVEFQALATRPVTANGWGNDDRTGECRSAKDRSPISPSTRNASYLSPLAKSDRYL